jgi:FKBP-type peptidyl-prolyl cis-trans isomerase
MKQSFYAVAAAFLLSSCTQSFKKTEMGMEYKIISDGKGKQLKPGGFFEITFDQSYKGPNKDTVLFESKNLSSQIVALDSNSIPPVYYNIFKQVRKGDSIVIRQMTDSIIKQQQGGGLPPFIKKGAHIISHYKIVNIFDTKEAADSAYKVQMAAARVRDSIQAIAQLKTDDKIITDYLAKNKINAVKGTAGTYVQMINPGEGDLVDTSKVVKVFYTGKSLETGKVFDSNTDPAFNHMQIFPVYLGAEPGSQGSVIKGWIDGLLLMKKGSKANFYIPSSLAYGKQGSGPDIKPNANLVFEVEVVEVVSAAQARAEALVEQQKMQAQQKKMMDSLQKAQKDTLKGK